MLFSLLLALLSGPAAAQDVTIATSAVMPTYVSLAPSLHDFTRFADGGPNGNWYVGFNNAWIVKLPAAPAGEFSRAFIGARLGRAKTRPKADKPWLRERIEGRVYMGLSPTPSFSAEQSFFLADLADIPMEGDAQNFVEGVGSAEWFWAEVPVGQIQTSRPNFLIVWSPSKGLVAASSAPILAAAVQDEPGTEPRAWNNHSILGVPPRTPQGALETQINNMSPALAIKLIPAAESEVSVGDFSLQKLPKRVVATFSVACTDLAEAWVEVSKDQLDWTRAGRVLRQQPFTFSLTPAQAAPGSYLRGAARDSLGKAGYSEAAMVPFDAKQ